MFLGILSLLALFIFLLTVLSFEGIIRVLFNLLLNYFLYPKDKCNVMTPIHTVLTEAGRPAFFNASISSSVKGCTACPSLMSSLVASVSSKYRPHFRIIHRRWVDSHTYFLQGARRCDSELLVHNVIG